MKSTIRARYADHVVIDDEGLYAEGERRVKTVWMSTSGCVTGLTPKGARRLAAELLRAVGVRLLPKSTRKTLRFCLFITYSVHGTQKQRDKWAEYAKGYVAACDDVLGTDVVDLVMEQNRLYRNGMKLGKAMIHGG